jgi:hypothetical protein
MQQVAARALAAVEHARSLFAASPASAPAAGAVLESAAESTTGAGRRADGLSGVLADRHRTFAGTAARHLSDTASTDSALEERLRAAATVTRAGAHRLEEIAARTRGIAATAGSAQSPAAQRTVVRLLQDQLAQANTVVNSAKRQAGVIAGQTRALGYGLGCGQALPLTPRGPIVWCVRPPGVSGKYRCSVLYPDLSVGTYWSFTDDSGGSLP